MRLEGFVEPPLESSARTYIVIEFMPTTTSGNVHLRKPQHIDHAKKAGQNQQVQPVLNRAQLGVQMRLTIGQSRPLASPSRRPVPATPAATR